MRRSSAIGLMSTTALFTTKFKTKQLCKRCPTHKNYNLRAKFNLQHNWKPMKIQSNALHAITVFQGCAHSCDWELWCAQYDHISGSPEKFVALEQTFEFLPTVQRLLAFTFPIEAEENIRQRAQHYLSWYGPGRNPSEIIEFCKYIVNLDNDALKQRCVSLVDTVCRRGLIDIHHIKKLNVWMEEYQAQTQKTTLLNALPDNNTARMGRKI